MASTLDFAVVIPARFPSTRLPGKPLAEIAGRPMVAHVHDRARESGAAEIVIATDDQRVLDVAEGFGATALLTSAEHPSGTDRIAEVIERMDWPEDRILVNLQGDEPLMPAALIHQVAENLAAHAEAQVATLGVPIDDPEELHNPHAVKVVIDQAGYAHYFSRAPIPWYRDGNHLDPRCPALRHVGLYAYRAGFVQRFVHWQHAPLEQVESLEQLRALWHGAPIHVGIAEHSPPAGVDTPEDLERVRQLLEARI